jgi:hypothetical protein
MKDNPFPPGMKKLKARDGYRVRAVITEFFSPLIALHASFESAQSDIAKMFIANYRSRAASFPRPSSSSTIRLMCL